MTKQELIEKNAELRHALNSTEADDSIRRKEFSKLLDNYELSTGYNYGTQKKELVIASWLEIAFMIGELKADANYSCVIEARERLKQDNQRLLERILDLENPPPTP